MSFFSRTFIASLLASLQFIGISANAQIFADFETSGGSFTIEMFHEDQPVAVASFIGLADGSRPWLDFETLEIQNGIPFYNGIKFHRVIKDFMIQGGSRNGVGTDNPGYSFGDRFAREEEGSLVHPHDQQGLISMANSGLNTNGSQFFITDAPTPWLDGLHIVFGQIAAGPAGSLEDGITAITAMNNTPVEGSSPIDDLVIQSITIRRVGDAALTFDIDAQGLPVLTAPAARLTVSPTPGESPQIDLHYTKPALSQVDVLASDDMRTWSTQKAKFYYQSDSSTDDLSQVYNDNDAMFFRLLKIDYSQTPLTGGPASIANATVKFDFDSIFDIDVTINEAGTGGTWTRTDGNGSGTLQSTAYTQTAVPYSLTISYNDLVPDSDFVFTMDISLSFDTATSGKFRTLNNGSPSKLEGTFMISQ
ncbi:MAG: cyclophilin family peptidyl-prolyl cis-trans isomerase [Verrucomicrobiales bacterium]|jgi:cyclophilin family peptidyl-prolyl cis-trans isomerase